MNQKLSNDRVFQGFLEVQHREAMKLAGESDLLEIQPKGTEPFQCWLARFRCKGLVRDKNGKVCEADDFRVGIYFPDDYLRRNNPMEVLTWLGPREIWHPNISSDFPVICVGRLGPGTPLVDILYQVFEVISYKKVTMMEQDALNNEACLWARRNTHRFPVDQRPLKRRRLNLKVTITKKADQP